MDQVLGDGSEWTSWVSGFFSSSYDCIAIALSQHIVHFVDITRQSNGVPLEEGMSLGWWLG